MVKRDPQRLRRMRLVVRRLIESDSLEKGAQKRLADYFGVTRQRVHQVVNEERRRHAAGPDGRDEARESAAQPG